MLSAQFHVPCLPPNGYVTFPQVTSFVRASHSSPVKGRPGPDRLQSQFPPGAVHHSDCAFRPTSGYLRPLSALTTHGLGQQKSKPSSPEAQGWIPGPNSTAPLKCSLGSSGLGILGKCVLNVKLQDNACCPQSRNLKKEPGLALWFHFLPGSRARRCRWARGGKHGRGGCCVQHGFLAVGCWETPTAPSSCGSGSQPSP